MIKKQFEIRQKDISCDYTDLEGLQSCIRYNGKFMTYSEIIKTLNAQHEIIQKQSVIIQKQKKENKQLKHELEFLEVFNLKPIL